MQLVIMDPIRPSGSTTNRIIFILSLIGILIALYVTQSFLRKSPIVCVNTGCELVRKSQASYILGIPVPTFGLVGYSLLTLLAFLRTTSVDRYRKFLPWMMGIALGGVGFVTWFTYTEAFIIHGFCTWCVLSSINMLTICILSVKSYITKE